MKIYIGYLALGLVCAEPALGGSPLTPEPLAIANGADWCFVTTPGDDPIDPMPGVRMARLYKFKANGEFEIKWQISEFWCWPNQMVISASGDNLVRVFDEYEVKNRNPQGDDIGGLPLLRFYSQGKLVKKYQVNDLVKRTRDVTMGQFKREYCILSGPNGKLPESMTWQEAELAIQIPVKIKGTLKLKPTEEVLILGTCECEQYVFRMSDGSVLAHFQEPEEEPEEATSPSKASKSKQ